jgi:Helix-turn-helix domain
MATNPEAGFVAPVWSAVEPLVHTSQAVETACVRRVGVIYHAIFERERAHAGSDRRFIKATGNTPVEYLQRVRVESAKKAFETTRKTINEVMYEVGYLDVKAFRAVFRKITGMSPLEYRK